MAARSRAPAVLSTNSSRRASSACTYSAPSHFSREARIDASTAACRARHRPSGWRSPVPDATTRARTRERGRPSGLGAISVTTTSRQALASSITEPSTTAARRRTGCGCPSAACTNSSTSSVRWTTASPWLRRLRSVRVASNGQNTSSSSPQRTPIAAQLTAPSGPVVVTTVSISGNCSSVGSTAAPDGGSSSANKAEELLARARVGAEPAPERGGDRAGSGLANAADRHAHVLGAQHDPHAARLQFLLEPIGDLDGHALLELQVPREELDHARELGEPDDAVPRQVRDVGDTVERQQVMH